MFLSQPFKKLLRYGECTLLPRSFDLFKKKSTYFQGTFLSEELEISVFFISNYLELFYKSLIMFNIY